MSIPRRPINRLAAVRRAGALIFLTAYRVNGLRLGDVMLIDFFPQCPRLHPGMMVRDDSQHYDLEWVCRVCGTRLYGRDPESAAPAQVSSEKPIKEGTGSGLIGRPRNVPTHYTQSKERDRKYTGKWYE